MSSSHTLTSPVGDRVGIGCYIEESRRGFLIRSLNKNLSASKSKLLAANDIITSVDDSSVVGQPIDAVRELVLGERGSFVKLHILRIGAGGEESEHDVSVMRGELDVDAGRLRLELDAAMQELVKLKIVIARHEETKRSDDREIFSLRERVRFCSDFCLVNSFLVLIGNGLRPPPPPTPTHPFPLRIHLPGAHFGGSAAHCEGAAGRGGCARCAVPNL